MIRKVVQEHLMGCGIACIASVAGVTYLEALKLVTAKYASTRGYYCRDIINALRKSGLRYDYKKVTPNTRKYMKKEGTIVFVKRSAKYPYGHYFVKTNKGWMNPWINYPNISQAKAGINKKLQGKAQWVIFKRN